MEAVYEPAQEVGGDFYWSQALPDGSPTPAFVELIKNLYRNRQVRAGTQRAAV